MHRQVLKLIHLVRKSLGDLTSEEVVVARNEYLQEAEEVSDRVLLRIGESVVLVRVEELDYVLALLLRCAINLVVSQQFLELFSQHEVIAVSVDSLERDVRLEVVIRSQLLSEEFYLHLSSSYFQQQVLQQTLGFNSQHCSLNLK